jgi:hypothetical protein
VVAGSFGLGESGGQGGPGRVGKNPFGMVGDALVDGVLETMDGLGAWGAPSEVSQDGSGCLLVAAAEMGDRLAGGCCLLLVSALFVPVGRGSRRVDQGEEDRYGEAAGVG